MDKQTTKISEPKEHQDPSELDKFKLHFELVPVQKTRRIKK